jgi:hypothetical protein
MTLGDLLVLYAVAGVASAGVVYRAAPETGRAALWSAALAVPLWPLWLPVALGAQRAKPAADSAAPSDATQAALWEAHQAVAGTNLEPLLPRQAVLRMLDELRRANARRRELDAILAQPELDAGAAERRVVELEHAGTSSRGLAPARLHLENVRQLAELRRRDEQTLLELRELAATLKTQLILARYQGSSPVDAGDILSEVWARVEVLGTTLETPHTGLGVRHDGDEARLASG